MKIFNLFCRGPHAWHVLVATALIGISPEIVSQTVLAPKQIAAAESLGRKTDLPMKLGTLVSAKQGGGFEAFITTPEQRVAYAISDKTSTTHGSGAKDPLVSELHLNRLRITGLPFPNIGASQHNSRSVTICDIAGRMCIRPAHEVLDVNQVVAEFDMPAVLRLSGASRTFLMRIENDVRNLEPEVQVSLDNLEKQTKKSR